MDGGFESFGVGEGLVGEAMGFEVAPNRFDVVEFGRIFGQSLDGEPMRAGGERRCRGIAGMDRAVIEHDHDRLAGRAGLGATEEIVSFQERDEVIAALGQHPARPAGPPAHSR